MFVRLFLFLQLALFLVPVAHTSPTNTWDKRAASVNATVPTVKLDQATVIGSTSGVVTSFRGLPFAEPPIGDLRLRLPQPVKCYEGTINATQQFSAQCVQLIPPIRTDAPTEMLQLMEAYTANLVPPIPQSEDCLTVDVQIPAGTKPGAKLPVIAFIFGGGFTIGSPSQFPGDAIISRSIQLGEPVIYVAINYRLHALGFLGGKEVKEEGVGNLGLHDQREGLRWIQKYISAFGGDPKKVTLWGPSSGAISAALQLVTNGGNPEGLFRGAVMNAGSPIPTGDITLLQPYYDEIVANAGCQESADTLDCLRQLPLDAFMNATTPLPNLFGYQGLDSPWAPRADGVFLTAPAQHLVEAGSVANIPVMTGDALDEGTIFATGSWNVTTEEQFRDYVAQFFFPRTPQDQLEPLFELYPNDPAQGSPFLTGDANQLAPMYKRMAAFQGDIIFQAPRRWFLEERSDKQPMWSFISQRGAVGALGFAHGTDFQPAIGIPSGQPDELGDYIIKFAATGDPNGASNRTIPWPKYDKNERKVLSILDGDTPIAIGNDTLRLEAMAGLSAFSLAYPL